MESIKLIGESVLSELDFCQIPENWEQKVSILKLDHIRYCLDKEKKLIITYIT